MELEKIFKLIEAGYTKEDIQALESPAPEAPAADPEPEPEVPAADTEPAPAPARQEQDQILAALNRLTDAVMKKNLNVTTAESTKPDTADILAKVIAPPKKG